MLTTLSTLLSIGNVGVMLLLSHWPRIGWYAQAAWQFAWLPYDIYSKQYGFLMLFATYLTISLLAIRRLNSGTRKTGGGETAEPEAPLADAPAESS
jgi:hypothetical protein